jgi:hypothetical protein
MFVLTERGREFLRRCKGYNERYVEAQKLLEDLGCERYELDLICKPQDCRLLAQTKRVR